MIVTKISGQIAELTLCRAPVNAISEDWVRRFDAELDALSGRTDWTILHVRSQQKAFCAGADLVEVRERIDQPDGPDRMYAFVAGIQRLYHRIERLPQVTLAEIGGPAMGGGLELALACDLRVVAVEAKLGLPEARLGLIPGAGGTQRLTKLCGPAVAARLILGAEIIDGAAASDLGIAHWAFAGSDLREKTAAIVRSIAALPSAALHACKRCIAAATEPGRGGYTDELEATRNLLGEPETRRRIDAFLAARADRATQRKQGAKQ